MFLQIYVDIQRFTYFWKHNIDAGCNSMQAKLKVVGLNPQLSSRLDWWARWCPICVNILFVFGISGTVRTYGIAYDLLRVVIDWARQNGMCHSPNSSSIILLKSVHWALLVFGLLCLPMGTWDAVWGTCTTLLEYFSELLTRVALCPFGHVMLIVGSDGHPRWGKRSDEYPGEYIAIDDGDGNGQ